MPTIDQQPASLNFLAVAGSPFAVTLDFTLTDESDNPISWSQFTNPTVVVLDAFGRLAPANVPEIATPSSGEVTISWSAAQMSGMENRLNRWAFTATLLGTGPLAICAGSIQSLPVTTPGTSTSSSASVNVSVGTATANVAVSLGGIGTGDLDGGAASSVYMASQIIDGGNA